MAVGDTADAVITKITPGYGKQLAWVTVKFYADDSGTPVMKEFPADNAKVQRVSVGDTILVRHLRLFGWQIDPSENLGK